MKLFVNIMLMLAFAQTYGQSKPLMPLKIGDKMPDVTLGEFRNYKTKTAKISDFKGKLLIIDFWNRWCTSCIRSFPHMENLQEQFGDKVAILLVTDDPMEAFEKLHKRSPTIKSTKLPFVIGDSILHSLFPHRTVPYHIWIDSQGYIKAMTEGSNASETNIRDFLSGKDVMLATRDAQLDFDTEAPLIEEGNGRQLKHLEYYSLIMHHLPNKVGVEVRIDSLWARVKIGNSPIIELYEFAFSFISKYSSGAGRVIVDSKNMNEYYSPSDKGKFVEWQTANEFCYESRWPLSLLGHTREKRLEKLKEIMRQDLDRFFQIRSGIETRNEKCLVLYRTSEQDLLKTKIIEKFRANGGTNNVIEKTRKNGYIFKNTNFDIIPGRIRLAISNGPAGISVIDETNYKGNIDATIDCDFKDIPKLRLELAKYGLGLKEAVRSITCLVLREADDN